MKIRKNIAISDEGLVFNPVTGESFSVNPIGIRIISLMKEGKSRTEIKKALHEEYDIDEKTLEKDLDDFTGMLNQYQILEGNDEKKA